MRGGGGGSGHPDPEIRGGPASKIFFFLALRASFRSKNKLGGRAPRAPPLDPLLTKMQKLLKMFTASLVIRVFLTFDLFDKTFKFAFFHKIFHDVFQFIHRTFPFSPFHNVSASIFGASFFLITANKRSLVIYFDIKESKKLGT